MYAYIKRESNRHHHRGAVIRRIAWELLCLLRWKVINYRRLIMGTARGVIDVCRGSCSGLAPYAPLEYACKHTPMLLVIHIACGKYLIA